MNFVFNEVPERINKNLVLCSLYFTRFIYKQGTIRHRIFRKIETKRRCCADYSGSDSNVATQVWVTVFSTWSLLLCLLLQIVWYEYLGVFKSKSQQHSSVKDIGCQTYTTTVLANHSSGRLLPSLQSTTPIQTKHSDEGGQNRTENSLLLLNYVFWFKNLDNIICGPQRTVQNN